MLKKFLSLSLLLFVKISSAQFFISNNSELHVLNDRRLYFDKNLQNEGLIEFVSDGELILDQGLDNSTGTMTLNNAILKLGSGTSRADGIHDLIFNNSNDTFNFVELDKHTGTLNVSSTGLLNIIETFTSNSGTLNANDQIILKSGTAVNTDYPSSHDPSLPAYPQTAIVPESSGGSVNGIRVERYFPGNRAWRFLSSPLDSDESIFVNWQQSGLDPGDAGYQEFVGTHITGGSAGNGFDQNASGNVSLFTYDNLIDDWTTYPNTTGTDLEIGQNYFTLVRGDRRINLLINDFTTEPPTVLKTTGSLHIGDFNVNHTFPTNTYFVASNPYQAPVDMNALRTESSNSFTQQMWVWQPEANNAGQYANVDLSTGNNTIPGSGSSDANEFLQPFQSVYLQAAIANPSLNFRENQKVDDSELIDILSSNMPNNFLRIGLYGVDQSPFVDIAHDGLIMVMENNFNSLPDNQDGAKFFNNEENIAIQYGNSFLSRDKRSEPLDLDEIVDLYFNNIDAENYNLSIELTGYDDLPNGLYLWDKYNDSYTALSNGLIIPINFDLAIPESLNQNRFAITFRDQTLGTENNFIESRINIYPNAFDENINITFAENLIGESFQIRIYNILGQTVYTRKAANTEAQLKLTNLNLSSGNYVLNISNEKMSQSFKLIRK